MSREFLDFIEDILDAMGKAEILLDGVTFEELVSDFRINFAVFRALVQSGGNSHNVIMTSCRTV